MVGGHASRENGGCDGKQGARGRGCAGAGRPVFGQSWPLERAVRIGCDMVTRQVSHGPGAGEASLPHQSEQSGPGLPRGSKRLCVRAGSTDLTSVSVIMRAWAATLQRAVVPARSRFPPEAVWRGFGGADVTLCPCTGICVSCRMQFGGDFLRETGGNAGSLSRSCEQFVNGLVPPGGAKVTEMQLGQSGGVRPRYSHPGATWERVMPR